MRLDTVIDRAAYLGWAAAKRIRRSGSSCPNCGNDAAVTLIHRKAIVTSLMRCDRCLLMYRTPKDDPGRERQFYEGRYREGFTTDLPSDPELAALLAANFEGNEKDYSSYIAVLHATGLDTGTTVLDFGSSWGYGSWQLAQAGYRVWSYEIDRHRATFGAEKLRCATVASPFDVPEPVDCFFSAHVIEHLSRPLDLWEIAAQTVKEDGVIVLFMPNGALARASDPGNRYHSLWGKVHPMMITSESLGWMARECGFEGRAFSSPYRIQSVETGGESALDGGELLYVARRSARHGHDGGSRGSGGGS